LADVFAYFELHFNFYFRRVSQTWRKLLTKTFRNNHLTFNLSSAPRCEIAVYSFDDPYYAYENNLPVNLKEWFDGQKDTQRRRGIFVFGYGQTFVRLAKGNTLVLNIKKGVAGMSSPLQFYLWWNVRLAASDLLELHIESRPRPTETVLPPGFRLVLKDCWITGVNWFTLLHHHLTKTLHIIHVTEMEEVNIGPMDKGRRHGMFASYEYGEGEAEVFAREMLRLGRKYAKPMTDKERRILQSTFQYYWQSQGNEYLPQFPNAFASLIRTHEPDFSELHPDALGVLSTSHPKVLKALTERLLEALTEDCNYV
ncbi:hypothetical protein RvY_14110, partial [Ramazzottius varieornatus]